MTSTTTDRLAGVTASLAVKSPVRAATTGNITLTAAQTIDGIAVVADDRVLVKNQTDTTENGIYDASNGDWTRAKDFDGVRDVVTGTLVFVVSGTANADTFWRVSTTGDPAPGDAMAFASASNNLGGASAYWLTVIDDATAEASRKSLLFTKGADIASAAALALGTDGNYFDVTGTTTITSIGTWNVGDIARLHFDGILTLTHHATNLILPNGADIKTAAGDEASFVEYAAGQWRCINYQPATGTILRGQGTDIASASPLVMTNVATDGTYFDVTGTTGFSAITVEAGRLFVLQFDGSLTLTHGASMSLPGGADITTAAGDSMLCFATAANTVDVIAYKAAAVGGGAAGVLPRNFIAGLELSKSAADAIGIAAGDARDATNAVSMTLAAFNKDVSTAWAVGTSNGSLDTGTYAASTLYYVWLIKRSDTGVVDVLTSISGTAPTMPTNYDYKRLIGAFVTDATPDIIAFQQVGDYFRFLGDVVLDVSDATIVSNTYEAVIVSAPRHSLVDLYIAWSNAASGDGIGQINVRTTGAADVSSSFLETAIHFDSAASTALAIGSKLTTLCDGSSSIDYAGVEVSGTTTVTISTLGFTMLTRSNPI